ncbi:MAG: hypothetical protein DDT28_01253 [Dehalococcoidia bacterium]|nr:hypothetical protein [Chloroflexota bacterium]
MMIATEIPMMYIEKTTSPWLAVKKAPARSTKIGSLAPQDMKGLIRTVVSLSRGFSIVRQAIIPGILQPKPRIMGMKERP